jgi:putative DNA-binding protein
MQRQVGGAIMTSLTPRWRTQQSSRPVAETFIKPNDRLTSFERLEIYNRQYWFRLMDCFYDDYPGLRAVLGDRRFAKLSHAYLVQHPSESFTLRNLGWRLESFLLKEPQLTSPHRQLALDMARIEWAHIVAFDEAAKPVIDVDDLLGSDPSKVRLALQPYVTLLEVSYPVDDLLLAAKKGDELMRSEASNAVALRHRRAKRLNVRRLKSRTRYIAVHRINNLVYYKSLDRAQYEVLQALQRGATLAKSCSTLLKQHNRSGEQASRLVQQWFSDWASFGWFCSRD